MSDLLAEFHEAHTQFVIDNHLEGIDVGSWPADSVERWRLACMEFEAEHGLL